MSPESHPSHPADTKFTNYDDMIHKALDPEGQSARQSAEASPSPADQPDKFHAALNPPEANAVYELAQQAAERQFVPGENVNYILADGQTVKAEVFQIEEVLNTTTHKFDQYITLHYHTPGDRLTDVHAVRVPGYKLAPMQLSTEDVMAARPQHDIESILGGQ